MGLRRAVRAVDAPGHGTRIAAATRHPRFDGDGPNLPAAAPSPFLKGPSRL
jgi:hypothetical protein